MKAKDLLPNTLYEVSGGGGYNAPYPGTQYVLTTDDVTPSAINWDGREVTRTVPIPDDKHVSGTPWDRVVPVRKFVSVHAVRWTGARPQSACRYVNPLDGSPIDMDDPHWAKKHTDYEVEWYTEYEPGTADHFFMEEGTSQMELRHIDSDHLNGDDDETFHDSEGRGIIFGYEGEPHQVARTLEQLTENHLHRYAASVVRENADVEEQRNRKSSNKVRWALISPHTFELLELTIVEKHRYHGTPQGYYSIGDGDVDVCLSLDQIEDIDALVRAAV